MKWTTKNDYNAMSSAHRVFNNAYASSCGSACGAGDDEKPEETATACGSACGAGDE